MQPNRSLAAQMPDAWLADEVLRLARVEGFSRVGLITTELVYAEGTLRRQIAARGLTCALPTIAERRELLYANELLDQDFESGTWHLLEVARSLREREGAQRVLVACPRYEERVQSVAGEHSLLLGVARLGAVLREHWSARAPAAPGGKSPPRAAFDFALGL